MDSDGWDRTAQLCSLAELCLDPYYRTIEGFAVLVEKEWMSFGFKFRDRLGLLSKPNKESSGSPSVGSQIHAASKSMQFSIASAAKSFLKQSTTAPSSNSSFTASKRYGSTSSSVNGGGGGGNGGHGPQGSIELVTPNYLASHEVSPVFTQFLDCVYQLWTQFPTHFEFSEKFLLALNTHLFSCRYGTFIFNNERERDTLLFNRGSGGSGVTADKISESVWDYFLSNKAEYLNPVYIIPESRDGSSNYSVKEDKFRTQSLSSSSPSSPTLVATSPITSDGDVLFPSPENARYWLGLYGGGEQTSEFFANLGRSEQAGEMAVLSVGAVSSVGTIGAGLRTGSYQPSVGDLDDESDAGGSTGGAAAPSASWQSAISSTAAQVSSNLATIAAASSWTSGWMNSPPSSSPSPSLTGGAANTVQVSSAMEAVAGPTKGRVASETRSSLQERLARTVERQMSNVDLKG
ncbi:hypothetical protein HDU83_000033 [Entophlyctis luteolus]|nr:hypothetical protein HDU83_000033 [Entophlyctis luteolus]